MNLAKTQTTVATDAPPPTHPPGLLYRRLPPLAYILISAFLLRVAAAFIVSHTYIWFTSGEMGNIAQSLASGHGFSSPFAQPTGETAWVSPLYPFLLAGIFKVFGIFSPASTAATLLFQIAISSLTCVPIVRLGEELGNSRLGLWAAWFWACYPYFVLLPVLFIWETSLDAFLLSCLLLITIRLPRGNRQLDWGAFGILWGLAALTNPASLALLPLCVAWVWWKLRGRAARQLIAGPAIALLVCLLAVAPWCWRNWKAFHAFIPIRSSFGENLWLGNHEGGSGRSQASDHVNQNPRELQRFERLGEVAYAKARQRAALNYIAGHPVNFFRDVIYRALYWWFAVGERSAVFLLYAALGVLTLAGIPFVFRAGVSEWYLIALSVLLFPVTYYLVDVLARYRHPVEPGMVLISAYLVDWIAGKLTRLKTAPGAPPGSDFC